MKNSKGLIAHCKMASGWKYIYGAKGTVLSYSQILNYQRMYGKNMVWDSDLNKAGSICCDCSGLIYTYTGILRNSSGYESTATASATVEQLKANWNAYIGWGIWTNGHIGIVSDTVGYYYAMDGSARNWSHRPIADNDWKKVIKLADIDYTDQAVAKDTLPDIIYRVQLADGRWLPEVKNMEDYAGIENREIIAIMIRLSDGTKIECNAHIIGGGWLGKVNGYNKDDFENGYAGDNEHIIDYIKIDCDKYQIAYKVSTTYNGTSYYPIVMDDGNDGAGVYGAPVDKFMAWINKKVA